MVSNVNESDSDAINTSPEDGVTENSASNVEKYENEPEVSEQEADAEADVEASSANADEDVSSEKADEEPSQSSRRESEQDQDVFKALDEAERADNLVPSPKPGAPVNPKADSVADNEDKDASKEGGSKRKCIILVLIFFICVAIVAIVLPFYLDYPPGRPAEQAPTNAPNPSSSAPPKPEPNTPTNTPTSSPTNAPTETPTTVQWALLLTTLLIPISGEEVFKDENSPQYLAAKHMLDDPYTELVRTKGRLEDRYASITFYFATEGENWKSCFFGDANCDSGQWLVDDVCDWYAVSCDDDGRVSSYLFGK